MKLQLQKRKRGAHFSLDEKAYLVKEFERDPERNNKIRLDHKITKASYYRIMKDKQRIMNSVAKSKEEEKEQI
jgi:hypothetical protein